MSTKKYTLTFRGPILHGSISTAKIHCGKQNCACKGTPPKLHGIYYRWTGFIKGRRTTVTLSSKLFQECRRRIHNHRQLQKKINSLIQKSIADAPWVNSKKL